MSSTLIPADADLALWAVLVFCVVVGFWAERHTRWGRKFSAIVITMTVGMLFANLHVIPTDAPVYHTIWEMVLPISISLMLFRADLRRAVREAGPVLLAFILGIGGILLGVFAALFLVPLGDLKAPMAGLFSATYIGGGANFAAVALAIEFQQGSELTAAVAADTVATNIYTLLLIALPGFAFVTRFFMNRHAGADGKEKAMVMDDNLHRIKDLDIVGLGFALLAAFAISALGEFSAQLIDKDNLAILFTTAYALALANLAPGVVKRFSADFEAGLFLIFIFLASLAATADIWVLAEVGPTLFIFASVLLLVHLVFVLVAGRLFKLDISEIIIGSTACVGGVTSASAIASAKGWKSLITPGILMGTVGNSVGTFIGVWMWSLFA